jgi:hypothetical protein
MNGNVKSEDPAPEGLSQAVLSSSRIFANIGATGLLSATDKSFSRAAATISGQDKTFSIPHKTHSRSGTVHSGLEKVTAISDTVMFGPERIMSIPHKTISVTEKLISTSAKEASNQPKVLFVKYLAPLFGKDAIFHCIGGKKETRNYQVVFGADMRNGRTLQRLLIKQ